MNVDKSISPKPHFKIGEVVDVLVRLSYVKELRDRVCCGFDLKQARILKKENDKQVKLEDGVCVLKRKYDEI